MPSIFAACDAGIKNRPNAEVDIEAIDDIVLIGFEIDDWYGKNCVTIEPRKVLGFDASNGLCVRRSSCAQASFTGFLICSSNAVFCAGVRGRLPPVLARFPKFRIAPIATTSPRSTPFARAAKLPKKYSSSFFQSMLSVNNFIAPDTICVKRVSNNPVWSMMYSTTVSANPAMLPDFIALKASIAACASELPRAEHAPFTRPLDTIFVYSAKDSPTVGRYFESLPPVPSPRPYFIALESIADNISVLSDFSYVCVNNDATLLISVSVATPSFILSAADKTAKAIVAS